MPVYRLYQVDDTEKAAQPYAEFDYPNDAVAICKTVRRVNGRKIEVWEGERLIIRYEPRKDRQPPCPSALRP